MVKWKPEANPKKCLGAILLMLSGVCGASAPAQALPDMGLDEFIRQFNQDALTPLFYTLEVVRQYENGMPELVSSVPFEDGTLIFSVYLNNQGSVVLSEELSYQLDCYDPANCFNNIQFEKGDREGNGQSLIESLWGHEVLEDFHASTLAAEDYTAYGTNYWNKMYWYEGDLFNYEVLNRRLDTGASIHIFSSFTVVSKQDSLTDRIDHYRYCISSPDNFIECP
ncbi:MAG: hypothetical protein VKJ09_02725 [Leptolyngbya sp.]|nr:hypothetical protein [Leptolyngbya sp.]